LTEHYTSTVIQSGVEVREINIARDWLDDVITEGDWLVTVLTAEAEPGGLAGQVILTVFAADGKATSVALGHPGIGLFRSGACDQFMVSFIINNNLAVGYRLFSSGFHPNTQTHANTSF